MTEKLGIAISPVGPEAEVDFGDFQHELSCVYKMLQAIDFDVNLRNRLRWLVTDLHHSTPAVEITAGTLDAAVEDGAAGLVLRTLFSGLNKLLKGSDAEEFGEDALDGLRTALKPIGQNVRETVLYWGDNAFHLDINLKKAIDRIRFKKVVFTEEWEGVVEEINVHGKQKTFRLYPAVGPRWITCQFDDDRLNQARAALTHKVQTHGRAEYRPNARYPHRIYVSEIVELEGAGSGLGAYQGILADKFNADDIPRMLADLRNEWGE